MAPRTGCARPCVAIQPTATRISCSSAALQQTGAKTEAARERELANRLSSRYAAWQTRAASGGELIPRGLERLHERLDRPAARMDMVVASAGQRDQTALAVFHLDAARRAFEREADREATQELRRALYLSPYLADAHLLQARILLRGGRAEDAVQALKIAIWSEETAAAQVALGEAYLEMENLPLARAAADRALALEPKSARSRRAEGQDPSPAVVLKSDLSTAYGQHDTGRRFPRNSAERQATRIPVHGRHRRFGGDLPERGAGRARRAADRGGSVAERRPSIDGAQPPPPPVESGNHAHHPARRASARPSGWGEAPRRELR